MTMCTEQPGKCLKAPPTPTLAVPICLLTTTYYAQRRLNTHTPHNTPTRTPQRSHAVARRSSLTRPLCAPSLALAPPWRVRCPLPTVRRASNHDTGERRRRAPASVSSLASVAGAGRCLTRWSGCVVCHAHAHARVYRRVLCSCK